MTNAKGSCLPSVRPLAFTSHLKGLAERPVVLLPSTGCTLVQVAP